VVLPLILTVPIITSNLYHYAQCSTLTEDSHSFLAKLRETYDEDRNSTTAFNTSSLKTRNPTEHITYIIRRVKIMLKYDGARILQAAYDWRFALPFLFELAD
jgi:hypothetical protein